MSLKLTDFEKSLVQEISTLSGYSPTVIREVLEFIFIRQVEEYFESKIISIPFLGKLQVIFKGDSFVSGGKLAEIETIFHASGLLKKIVGEAEDKNLKLLEQLISSKIEEALQNILES